MQQTKSRNLPEKLAWNGHNSSALVTSLLLQGSEPGSPQMLVGTILHDIFQQSVTNNLTQEKVQELANKIVYGQKYLKEM